MTKEIKIKGMCEQCGFAFKGRVHFPTEAYESIICPVCKNETDNFDDAHSVDELNRENGHGKIKYVRCDDLEISVKL